jgi:hypothetical protein
MANRQPQTFEWCSVTCTGQVRPPAVKHLLHSGISQTSLLLHQCSTVGLVRLVRSSVSLDPLDSSLLYTPPFASLSRSLSLSLHRLFDWSLTSKQDPSEDCRVGPQLVPTPSPSQSLAPHSHTLITLSDHSLQNQFTLFDALFPSLAFTSLPLLFLICSSSLLLLLSSNSNSIQAAPPLKIQTIVCYSSRSYQRFRGKRGVLKPQLNRFICLSPQTDREELV